MKYLRIGLYSILGRTILLALLAFMLPLTSSADTDVLTGEIIEFNSPDDLIGPAGHLDPSKVLIAVDVFGDPVDGGRDVNGVTFLSDGQQNGSGTATANGVTVEITAANQINNWAAAPNFSGGSGDSAANLSEVMRDIRWHGAPNPINVNITGLTPGSYQVTLLTNEGADRNRRWDIGVNGELAVDDYTSEGDSASGVWTATNSFGYSGAFTTNEDGSINVVMQQHIGGQDPSEGDNNPILQGVLVSSLGGGVPAKFGQDPLSDDGPPDGWDLTAILTTPLEAPEGAPTVGMPVSWSYVVDPDRAGAVEAGEHIVAPFLVVHDLGNDEWRVLGVGESHQPSTAGPQEGLPWVLARGTDLIDTSRDDVTYHIGAFQGHPGFANNQAGSVIPFGAEGGPGMFGYDNGPDEELQPDQVLTMGHASGPGGRDYAFNFDFQFGADDGPGPFSDEDLDGLFKIVEEQHGLDPNNPDDAGSDADGDGLDALTEILRLGTDPNNADTDGDGLGDGQEIALGLDPATSDSDGDGLGDGLEQAIGTYAGQRDTDGDGFSDDSELCYVQEYNFPDGTTDLGDGSIVTNNQDAGSVQGGRLQLTTDDVNSQVANYMLPVIPELGSAQSFKICFDLALFDAEGGNPPADGFSFNLGAIADDASAGEEGHEDGLVVSFDTWDNGGEGAATGIGVDIRVNNAEVATNRIGADEDKNNNSIFNFDGISRKVTISYSGDGTSGAVSVSLGDNQLYSGQAVDWAPEAGDRVAFGARTGGANETVSFDNLAIACDADPLDPTVPTLGDFLKVHYTFDDDAEGATEVINNGTAGNGTLEGPNAAGTIIAAGGSPQGGGAATFDDTVTYINTNNNADQLGVNGPNDYTMSAWMNLANSSGDHMVFGQPEGNALHNGTRGGGYHIGHWGNDITVGSVDVGNWRHVVWRYAGGVEEVFVDGSSVGAAARGPLNNGGPVFVGQTRNEGGRDYEGLLDDVRLYCTALPNEAIASLANNEEPAGPNIAGLKHEWWQNGNPGNRAAVEGVFNSRPPDNGPFKGSDDGGTGTWWTGNGGGIEGVQTYPPVTTLGRDNYMTRLSGQIKFPEDGTYKFKDGVDDYTFLFIDVNGNGVEDEGEVLVDDNTWTGIEGNQNGGSPIGTVEATAGWVDIVMYTAEGGGGDGGVLYWDYGPEGPGTGVGFPAAPGDAIDLAENAANLLVPDECLRAVILPPKDSDGDGILDSEEEALFGDLSQDLGDDSDGDHLTNAEEREAGTAMNNKDTDGDGLWDGIEVKVENRFATDPTDADSDNDGLSDREELFVYGTDPNNADTDGDMLSDGFEVANACLYQQDYEGDFGKQLLAHWTFDENTNDSVNGIVGENVEGSLTEGKNGQGFTGGYVNVTEGADIFNVASGQNAMTVVFWQKNNATPNSSSFWFHSPTTGAGQRAFQAHAPWGNGSIFFDTAGCCDGGTQRINGDPTGFNDFAWDNGEFDHFAFVKNGDQKIVYINGQPWLEGTNTGVLPTDINRLAILSGENGGNRADAVIDDFAVFAGALSGEQIAQIAGGTSPADVDLSGGPIEFGDGSFATNNQAGGSSVADGVFNFTTDGVNSQAANYYLPVIPGLTGGFTLEVDLALVDETGNPPADGFSFNIGQIADDASAGEEGHAEGLSVNFDTWNNGGEGAATGIGVDLKVDGAEVATNRIGADEDANNNSIFNFDGQFRQVVITYERDGDAGTVSVSLGGNQLYTDEPVAWVPEGSDRIAFGARTGGANESVIFDNLCIFGDVPFDPLAFNAPQAPTISGGTVRNIDFAEGAGDLNGALPTFDGVLPAPIAFYSFDNGEAPLTDDSGSGNDLTGADADPTYVADGGIEGGAYEYDGTQRLVAPININPGEIPKLTLGAWVKTSNLDPGLRKVMGHDNGGWDRTIGLDNREGDFRYTSFIGNGRPVVGTPGPESVDHWTFLAASYDQTANEVTVYVDVDSSTTDDALVAVTEPTAFGDGFDTFAIGGLRPDNANEGWAGAIDNVFVFDDALSADQLTQIRDGGKAAIEGAGGATVPIASEVTVPLESINYKDDGGDRNFPGDRPYPVYGTFGGHDFIGIDARGTINVSTPGLWTFLASSDDGVILWIDGEIVIDDRGNHGTRNVFGAKDLTAGEHSIRVAHYEQGGGAAVEVGVANVPR